VASITHVSSVTAVGFTVRPPELLGSIDQADDVSAASIVPRSRRCRTRHTSGVGEADQPSRRSRPLLLRTRHTSGVGEADPSFPYTPSVHSDIAKVLLTAEQIATRIAALGREIAGDLERLGPSDGIVLVPVMTGSVIFVADLVRHLPLKLRIGVATVSSYPGKSTSSQGATIVGQLPSDLTGRHVIVIDDILDSGRTIRLLRDAIEAQKPASVRTCVLLRKPTRDAQSTPCDYVGFDIPDEFVVGYGLDYDDHYRNLPYVGVLRPEAT